MKITYESHYRSSREDGRHVSTMASFLELLRNREAKLALPEALSRDGFDAWKGDLKNKVKELLQLDFFEKEAEGQPAPRLLSCVKRDTYKVERWEFYPDRYSAVPFLALIPYIASEENKVPAVMCFPGSTFSKEFIAGEPLLDKAACKMVKYPERNKMALYMVKNGMAAFAFDNPEIAECALEIERPNEYGGTSRKQLCHGLLQSGLSYFGISTSQKLVALDFIKNLPYVDNERIAVSAHSLGCDDAMHVALLRDEIRAIVFNDFVADARHRYYATTDYDEDQMRNDVGPWHIVPGQYMNYDRSDLLAALAPRWLALNEGGAQYYIDKVLRGYRVFDAEDRVQITHYPKYSSPDVRSKDYFPPIAGLTGEGYFKYTNTDALDHSFREEPSIRLLKKAFGC